MSMPDDDPTRGFLDQTVPRDDAWEGREPDDGPARPRHVQHPAEDDVHTSKERRKQSLRNAAWTLGPGAAFLAGTAFAGNADAEPDPPEPDLLDFGELGGGL